MHGTQKKQVQLQVPHLEIHDVATLTAGFQDLHEVPMILPGLHHMIRDWDTSIDHIMRKANDMLPCLPVENPGILEGNFH